MSRIDDLRQLSSELVQRAKGVKVLTALSWEENAAEKFLASWSSGSPVPPTRSAYEDVEDLDTSLEDIEKRCDREDPCSSYIADTAHSYRLAVRLLRQQGTPEFYRISTELYGGADGILAGSSLSHREAAARLLQATTGLASSIDPHAYDLCVTAHGVAEQLEADWRDFFETPLTITIDPKLSSKAAASATTVRLRAGTCFSTQDAAQLSAHEIGVHSLTARNGRAQPVLGALGLGAPRTTATQEGLATFAELVTGAIDLGRLRRLALRICAVGLAEDGADFVELFRYLVEVGESPFEAVHTTMRIFRGGDLRGRYVFTKDVSYLKGLFSVHTFLRKAVDENSPELVHRLFVGRLTLRDISTMDGDFEKIIEAPRYLPRWVTNLPCLAAFLAFSTLMNQVDIGSIEQHFQDAPK